MVWSQLELETPHIAYACVGIFSTVFSLVSLFVKERLFIGEATVATIAGLILGPHCLDWFNPISWGNADYITLEICRIVLCIQIVAVAVELPRKYMKNHWLSVAILLIPVMTCGWLVVGLFIWVLTPHFKFQDALLISACITATDPVLAAAVVGKGKFAERVPGHLRNLLTAESGCNDGMAFPFIYLALNLVIYAGKGGEIVKEWILLCILWECFFGIILGVVLGYSLRHAVRFAEKKDLIDRESFLAIFVFLAFNSAGIGSMLGVDDLLVSFAAGTAFGWDGSFARKTEESHVSTVIDLLLNLAFFVYFGAIVPWAEFNNGSIGLNCWRLIILAIVVIFLRRLPVVIALKPFTPDIKTWREAFFCGHFGPIGVGAIFASILARKELEGHYTKEETPLAHIPTHDFPHNQVLAAIWPMVCFVVITSIIVHGSSVAVLTLGKRLNRMAITMTFTTTNTQEQGPSWMSRLQKLDKATTSFSLHRIDTAVDSPEGEDQNGETHNANTIETSGVKFRPAGGARRKMHKKRKGPGSKFKRTLSKAHSREDSKEHHRPQSEFLQLGRSTSAYTGAEDSSPSAAESPIYNGSESTSYEKEPKKKEEEKISLEAYQEGDKMIIENEEGEALDAIPINDHLGKLEGDKIKPVNSPNQSEDLSIHSLGSLRREMSHYVPFEEEKDDSSINSEQEESDGRSISRSSSMATGPARKAFYKRNDPHRHKVFAHQVNDYLLIENEDGEIIRRYRVRRHPKPKHVSKTPTLVGKALSMVGIKQKGLESQPEKPQEHSDLEQGVDNVLIPDTDGKEKKSELSNPKISSKMENKLNALLKDPKGKKSPEKENDSNRPLDEKELNKSSKKKDDNKKTGNTEQLSDDDILRETDVEKSRRLAALGELPKGERDVNDEEE